MKEQYERFIQALATWDNCSTNCEKCPIRAECEAFSSQLPPEENLKPEYACEAILFNWVVTGNPPSM